MCHLVHTYAPCHKVVLNYQIFNTLLLLKVLIVLWLHQTQLVLSEMAILKIQNIFQDSVSDTLAQSKSSIVPVISITDETVPDNCRSADHWIKCGRVALTKKDKQLILNDKELLDVHVNAFQSIARREFPQVGGFHNTLVLHKMTLMEEGCEQFVQIMHIKEKSHWATLQLIGRDIYFVMYISQ